MRGRQDEAVGIEWRKNSMVNWQGQELPMWHEGAVDSIWEMCLGLNPPLPLPFYPQHWSGFPAATRCVSTCLALSLSRNWPSLDKQGYFIHFHGKTPWLWAKREN